MTNPEHSHNVSRRLFGVRHERQSQRNQNHRRRHPTSITSRRREALLLCVAEEEIRDRDQAIKSECIVSTEGTETTRTCLTLRHKYL